MSKERLEDIKAHFAYCMDEGLLFSEQEEVLLVELYEQAERAQELDKELEQREIDSMEAHYRNKNHVSELKEQNKRYREARDKLDAIFDERSIPYPGEYDSGYLDGLDRCIGIINEALEESE